jgi:hypothetical protein
LGEALGEFRVTVGVAGLQGGEARRHRRSALSRWIRLQLGDAAVSSSELAVNNSSRAEMRESMAEARSLRPRNRSENRRFQRSSCTSNQQLKPAISLRSSLKFGSITPRASIVRVMGRGGFQD